MKTPWVMVTAVLAALLGCGSEVQYAESGAGGGSTTTSSTMPTTSTTSLTTTSSTSTTSTGGSGGAPPGCAVATTLAPPYPVTIRLTAVDGPVFVRGECDIDLEISSCVDGYTEPVAIDRGCTVDCVSDPDVCIACEPCLASAVPVGNDAVVDVPWLGFQYSFGTNIADCPCSNEQVAPAAHYRVSVPVYGTAEQALNGGPSWIAEADFTLPADGPVYVALTGI